MALFPQLNSITNRILNLLQNCTLPTHLYQIQAQLILHNLHSNTTVAYHLINCCESLSLLDTAFLLYIKLPKPHIFICNTLIRAFSHSTHLSHNSISLYTRMHKNSILPNNFTFPFMLKSLSHLRDFNRGQSVHTQIIKLGHCDDIYVGNSLLSLYASCGKMDKCQQVFEEMPLRDVVSWTIMITGYREARKMDDALMTFEQMQYAGVVPNQVTMVNALAACASFSALEIGVWIHDFIRRNKWELDVILGTCLIDMYAKCSKIEEGLCVFKSMKEKNVYTWNSLISGLALAKNGEEAVWWFSRMKEEGIKPDEVTLIGVLCACVHSEMVTVGRQIFSELTNGKYGFFPGVKHYACIIDLLARSGNLNDAFKLIKEMPFEPSTSIWGSLLTGCKAHGNQELSVFAASKLIELEPDNSAHYIVLSNLYAEMGRWTDVENIRSLMKERGLTKILGYSSVQYNSLDHVYELLA